MTTIKGILNKAVHNQLGEDRISYLKFTFTASMLHTDTRLLSISLQDMIDLAKLSLIEEI